MTKITTFILDDEPRAVEYLVSLLQDIPDVSVVGSSSNSVNALEEVLHLKPDILFLDYSMPQLNGFAFYDALVEKGYCPVTVYVTAYDNQAINACHRSAFDYLLKPVTGEDLVALITRYNTSRAFKPTVNSLVCKKLKFNLRTGFVLIDPREIAFCGAEGNYTDIFLIDGRKITITLTLGKVAELLPDSQIFRINRSFIINIRFLASVDRKFQKAILMYGGRTWEVSINASQTRELEDYLEGTMIVG